MQTLYAPLAPECQQNNDKPVSFGLRGPYTPPRVAPQLSQRELALLLFALEGEGGRHGATVH
jgi:hypothetical protein